MRKRKLVERLTATETVLDEYSDNLIHAVETLAQLELAREDVGWIKLGAFNGQELSRDFLRGMYDDAVTSYIKNPLTNHGVKVQGDYVFGQGLTITGDSDEVDKLWQLFWSEPSNRIEFTTIRALFLKEVDLQLEGNLFLALFTSKVTGAVRVRTIHSNEIADIITNPDDSNEPWFYKRVWSSNLLNESGAFAPLVEKVEYYPAWNYRPTGRPSTYSGKPINWDSPVYHVRVGGTSHMRFGVTEIYSSLDWAKAYKQRMEDWATVSSSLARFVWQLTHKGGKEGVAAGKAKLNTTYGDSAGETNPSSVAGSTFIGAAGVAQLEVLKTSGAQAHPEEARALAVMVAAGHGLPYSILTGDADKSNLATAKSLDRPTELAMSMRQAMWTDIFGDINSYLIYASVKAPSGVVKGKVVVDEWGTEQVILNSKAETTITVEWPPILEHDVEATVRAIVMAATLDGKTDAGIFDLGTLIQKLAAAIGVDNIGKVVEDMIAKAEAAPPAESVAEEVAFVEILKEVAAKLREERE